MLLPWPAVALTHGRCARDGTRKHFMSRKTLTAIVPQGGRVSLGKLARTFEESFALVGFGQHQCERTTFRAAAAPTVCILIAKFADERQQLERDKILRMVSRLKLFSIGEHHN